VFALTGESELAEAERRYLPARTEDRDEGQAAAAPERAAA
jgi:hypothetical protein